MTNMRKLEIIHNIIKDDWSKEEIVNAWNDRCYKLNYPDSVILHMDMFDEEMEGMSPLDIIRAARYNNFQPNDDFWAYDGYGNPTSFSYPEDYDAFDFYGLVYYVADNAKKYNIDKDVLKENFFEDDESPKAMEVLESLIEEEGVDLVTDDWDALGKEINVILDSNNN